MKVLIKVEDKRFYIPVPISLGVIAVKCTPKKYITIEQKKLVISTLKVIKRELKQYKGMKIVDVEASSGERISITI